MFTLCVKDSFAAAHRLEAYHGKCENLHGHNFMVEAFFEGERLNEEGMLVDFAILKGYVNEALSELDHKYINEIPFFQERASSSEYIALHLYERLRTLLKEKSVSVREVRVWESEKVYAAFRG
jgi:6-pyruvoyltetrahydropterin/6-carboxytetrahydropterin synthase